MPSNEPAARGHQRHNPNGKAASAYTNTVGGKPMAHLQPVKPVLPQYQALQVYTSYIGAVDSITETQGYGVAVLNEEGSQILRPPQSGGNTIVIETSSSSAKSKLDYGTEKERHDELWNMVTSCGGAGISAVGAGLSYAALPVTGGLDAPAAAWLTVTTAASAGQCGSSVYRWYSINHGRNDILKARDQSNFYVWSNRLGDAIGLLDGAKSLKELWHAQSLLRDANISFRSALDGKMSRQMRAQTARLWELGHDAGQKLRVTAEEIHLVTKTKLVGGISAAYGYSTSYATGVLHEVTAWIIESKENREKNNR